MQKCIPFLFFQKDPNSGTKQPDRLIRDILVFHHQDSIYWSSF